jgi:hypothetical protein
MTMSVKLDRGRHMKRFGICIVLLAVVTGLAGCGVPAPIPYPGPSLDLEIRTWYDLDAVRDNLAGHHRLMNSLNATTHGYEELASAGANEGNGWEPIGTWLWNDPHKYGAFTGTFDGQGYEISDLWIDWPHFNVGLFGYVHEGTIDSVRLVNAVVTGRQCVGGLVGYNSGVVANSSATGNVVSRQHDAGGLVGWNNGNVIMCHAAADVTGDQGVGGLVGGNSGNVDSSYSTGDIDGQWMVGGLVGVNSEGSVVNSFFEGSVAGRRAVGGLVGQSGGTVGNSYSAATVIGEEEVGGLVGKNYYDAFYAPGAGTISECYAIGKVSGLSLVGGLVGDSPGSVIASFWDTGTTGQTVSGGGTGKTTAEMMDIFTYTDTVAEGLDEPWDMVAVVLGETDDDYVWNIVDGETYPFLSWEQVIGIWNWYDLDAVRDNLSGHYLLMNDLDADTAGYEELAGPSANEGSGWQPIGSEESGFIGRLDGQGYAIRDLFIDRPEEDRVGLFGTVGVGGVVEDVLIIDVAVTGQHLVGGLVGGNDGAVRDSYASGSVTGQCYVGALVGRNQRGMVRNCHSQGSVMGDWGVGGLVGWNDSAGTVSSSYASGNVTGESPVGGLVGHNMGDIDNSYSVCDVTSFGIAGGLVGLNEGTVWYTYSTGSVTDHEGAGGLVGFYGGGGEVFGSYWDVEASGIWESAGGWGMTTEEMMDILIYIWEDWDIISVEPGEIDDAYTWNIVDGQTYPFLSWQSV